MNETSPTPVRVRFAPSPTGYLHIGGVRTALFNWLFARRHGGQFILRVDDTDAQRNVAEALAPILAGFRWLGMTWDEGPEAGGPHEPYYQSQRGAAYQAAVDTLLANGYAYRDYATPEEYQAERTAAEAEKRPFVYSRKYAGPEFAGSGRPSVVRLKMPREGVCRIEDVVRGTVEMEWATEADHVIQRADGSCLYHLASVADDVAMGITHVIRAEEHLSNTPRQIWIFEGLKATLPVFAHLPVVAEPGSKVKLSKRKLDKYLKNAEFKDLYERGRRIAEQLKLEVTPETFNPVVVDFYAESGFLPEAVLNYLMLLGWSLDDKTEFLSDEERVANFSLERVNKASASFDAKKLLSFQEHYMTKLPIDRKVERCLDYLVRAGWVPVSTAERERVERIVAAAGERLKVFGDIFDYPEFFGEIHDGDFAKRFVAAIDGKAFTKRIDEPAAELLAQVANELPGHEDFTPPYLESFLHRFMETRGLGLGAIVHALRVALTGRAVGFGLFDIVSILGRDEVVARIALALKLRSEGHFS
jgi:glutamyl-tRNA synthetase